MKAPQSSYRHMYAKDKQSERQPALQEDGNVALYGEGGEFVGWATNTGEYRMPDSLKFNHCCIWCITDGTLLHFPFCKAFTSWPAVGGDAGYGTLAQVACNQSTASESAADF